MTHVTKYLTTIADTLTAMAASGTDLPARDAGTLGANLATVARALKTPDPQPPGSDYPRIRADGHWPQLAARLAQAATSRPDLPALVRSAAAHPLPDELPAAGRR